ncbi:TPA: hypothetical protein NIJ37_003515 [Pseudomonas aeruginosa]|nr:hypothetical protein [Pseudomonas aeruginosa]
MARKKRKAPWIDRRCCDWDTFLSSLMAAAQRQLFPLLLVNWCEARRYWRQHSCTGAEVIQMQRAREVNEALYNGYGEPPANGGSHGGGAGPVSPVRPSPIKPVTLA